MTPPAHVHVAIASLNQTVGDWAGNTARIRQALREARSRGARLLGLPEMCISGYSLGDRVSMRGTLERAWQAAEELAAETQGLITTLGLPISHMGVVYDAVVVVADGRIQGIVPKQNLATGDVEYENRWYGAWPRGQVEVFTAPDGTRIPMGDLVLEADGIGRFAIEICEDGWKGVRPGSIAALMGAHIVLNASASWFTLGKHAIRRRMVQDISRQDRVAYLYTSLHGCDATRLIFDGSVLGAVDGEQILEAPRFQFNTDVVMEDTVLDVAAIQRGRLTEGSWRQQVQGLDDGSFGPLPQVVRLTGTYPTHEVAKAPRAYWLPPAAGSVDPSLEWLEQSSLLSSPLTAQELPHIELELALAMGLHEYTRKTGIKGVALALSGGRDSSMCAVLLHRMMRYRHPRLGSAALQDKMRPFLVTAYLATDHSGDATTRAAQELADEIGAEHLHTNLQQAVDLHRELVGDMVGEQISWSDPAYDIPLQNVQARLRGSLIWMVANLRQRLLITTSNKSEVAVGYATMDGDTCGGLAPIADVPKSMVTAWLRWARDRHGYVSLRHVLSTPATAELRPPEQLQTDEEDLMPFSVLDRLMYHFAYLGEEPLVLFERLWPEFADAYDGDARAFAAHIRKFVRMFCTSQWKRERYAISFRVTAFDLDPKTGFRFPPVQAPFSEELADMDALVAELAG